MLHVLEPVDESAIGRNPRLGRCGDMSVLGVGHLEKALSKASAGHDVGVVDCTEQIHTHPENLGIFLTE